MRKRETYDITGLNDDQIRSIIKSIFRNHSGNGGSHVINAKANKCLIDFIMRATSYFDKNPIYSFINLTTRCYMIVNDLEEKDFPRCEYCGKIIQANAVSMKRGFPYKTCSRSCAALNPKRKHKIEETNAKLGRHLHWSNWEKAKQTQKSKPQEVIDAENEKRKLTVKRHEEEDKEYWLKREMKGKATKVANGHDPNWNNHAQASETKRKRAEEDPLYWKKITEKEMATNMKNGHDPNWRNSEQGIATLRRHEQEDPQFWEKIENKRKITKVSNGYDENWNNSEKTMSTCMERYGSTSYLSSEEGKKRIAQTCIERYGVKNPIMNAEIKRKMADKKYMKYFQMICADEDEVEPMFTYDEFRAKTKSTMFKWRCKKCGNVFESPVNFQLARDETSGIKGTFARCLKCHPIALRSLQQYEVAQFIADIVGKSKVKYNDRRTIYPKEIDILISSMKIGFEYDGMYWHSSMSGSDSCSALEKTTLCEDAGLTLFRIYEDDWRNRKDAVKNEICKVLGKATIKIGSEDDLIAVKCSASEAEDFYEAYSISFHRSSGQFNVCMRANDMTIAMMSANMSNDKLIISNFSSISSTLPASDMFKRMNDLLMSNKRFRHINAIQMKISRDWPVSDFLKNNGFEMTSVSRPNNYLLDCADWKRKKSNVSKNDILNDINLNTNAERTLVENLHANKLCLIHDAGNITFIKNALML